MKRWAAASCVLVLAAALVQCSAASGRGAAPVTTSAGPTETVLALGGSATEGDGVRDRLENAWPYLVFRDALPVTTAFVNGALDGATIANALLYQAPLASELKPDLVEVWLGADDVLASTPIPTFTDQLDQLIETLQHAGSRRILVGDLPAAYGSKVAAYNDAIHSVVAQTHVELVSLSNAAITLVPIGGRTDQPDAASHQLVASAFERRIKQ